MVLLPMLVAGCSGQGSDPGPEDRPRTTSQTLRFDFDGNTTARELPFLVQAPSWLNITIWTNATDAGPYAVTGVVGVLVGMSWGAYVTVPQPDGGTFSFSQGGRPLAGVAMDEEVLLAPKAEGAYIQSGLGKVTIHGVGNNVAVFVRLETYRSAWDL